MEKRTHSRVTGMPASEDVLDDRMHEEPDARVDPDLLVLDEGEAAKLLRAEELEPEPVDSYVPPYVPDPPPETAEDRTVRVYRTKSPRWFRMLFLAAFALIVAAAGSVLHRQGYLERWFSQLRGPDEPVVAEVLPEPPLPDPATGPTDRPADPVTPVEPDPPEDPDPPPYDGPRPPPDDPLPDPAEDLRPKPKTIEVELSDNRKVTLLAGEILVELRNGNYLKGRLHKVTDDILRLAMAGGYVDVKLSRLRKADGPGDAPVQPITAFPRAEVLLKTGEHLRGRLKRRTETEVELVFPSGKIVLRNDMVKYVWRR
jgi:hypothetical protein